MTTKTWGVLERDRQYLLWLEWRKSMVPFEILDKLIAANLGDIPQVEITRQQFEKAMKGRKWITC